MECNRPFLLCTFRSNAGHTQGCSRGAVCVIGMRETARAHLLYHSGIYGQHTSCLFETGSYSSHGVSKSNQGCMSYSLASVCTTRPTVKYVNSGIISISFGFIFVALQRKSSSHLSLAKPTIQLRVNFIDPPCPNQRLAGTCLKRTRRAFNAVPSKMFPQSKIIQPPVMVRALMMVQTVIDKDSISDSSTVKDGSVVRESSPPKINSSSKTIWTTKKFSLSKIGILKKTNDGKPWSQRSRGRIRLILMLCVKYK